MEILMLLVPISLALAASGVGLFVWTVRTRTFDHADRLALLPLDGAEAPRRGEPNPIDPAASRGDVPTRRLRAVPHALEAQADRENQGKQENRS